MGVFVSGGTSGDRRFASSFRLFHKLVATLCYILGCPPAQDSSHHKDYCIFSRGSQPKPSFATVTGRGDNPSYIRCVIPLWEMPFL